MRCDELTWFKEDFYLIRDGYFSDHKAVILFLLAFCDVEHQIDCSDYTDGMFYSLVLK